MLVEVSDDAIQESSAWNAAIESAFAASLSIHELGHLEARRQQLVGEGVFTAPVYSPRAVDHAVMTSIGKVGIRTVAVENPVGVYLHFHGGGFTIGSASAQDQVLDRIATNVGVTVVSVDYRLAPEHPFPAAVEDCSGVAETLLSSPDSISPGLRRELPLVIGGESAGANLAVAALIRLRDAGVDIERIVGANLNYGVYDLSHTPSVRLWGDRNLILSHPVMEWFNECYTAASDPQRRRNPSISPLYADLRGLPEALFSVGTVDPLLDDSAFMAQRWELAGNRSRLDVYPESTHLFDMFPTQIGKIASARQDAFIRNRVLSPPAWG